MRKETPPELRKETKEPTTARTTTRTYTRVYTTNLDEVIKSVYRRYGTDLPAFFRDAYKAEREKQKASERRAEACLP